MKTIKVIVEFTIKDGETADKNELTAMVKHSVNESALYADESLVNIVKYEVKAAD